MKLYEALGFPHVLENIQKHINSEVSLELIGEIIHSSNSQEVRNLLSETSEYMDILSSEDSPPSISLWPIMESLKRAGAGATYLAAESFVPIIQTLRTINRIGDFFDSNRVKKYPVLSRRTEDLPEFKVLVRNLHNAIDDDGSVRTEASVKLSNIRTQLKSTEQDIIRKLEEVLNSSKYEEMIGEKIVTRKDGRYVIPILADRKNSIKGIIHGQSRSGVTVFLEPLFAVKMNNQLRELLNDEENEITRILGELTKMVQERYLEIFDGLKRAAILDWISAKARYSHDIRGIFPKVNDNGDILLLEARHPLLYDQAVPVDIRFESPLKSIIITGPNAGGKTVSLKITGLFTIMAGCGILIPCYRDSKISVFDNIFCDIGDSQSILNHLSTFSSHIANIINLVQYCTPKSLVLLDELGDGTDPEEGSALARSIMEFLHQRGCKTLVTTHYPLLKIFAHETPDALNCSMEFDLNTLRPCYRVLEGISGKSFAIEVATNLGLNKRILKRAEEILDGRRNREDEVVSKLEEERKKLNAVRSETEQIRQELLKKSREFDDKLHTLHEEFSSREMEILEEKRELVRKYSSMVDHLQKNKPESLEESQNLKKELGKEEARISNRKKKVFKKVKKPVVQDHLQVNDLVFDTKLKLEGVIEEVDLKKGTARVQTENMTLTLPLDQLERKGQYKIPKNSKEVVHIPSVKLEDMRLDLRGCYADEALEKVGIFMAKAVVSSMEEATIIHGMGTGKLRKVIWNYLKDHPSVEKYRLGETYEGSTGVTIVTFRV